MFWLKYIQSLFKTLNADTSPNEIASGVMLGSIIGLMPKFNLLALALWVVVLMFRTNFGMATASVVIFAIVGSITDPWAEHLGFYLLTGVPALKSFWTALYNMPIVPFTAFNNTLVLGNFVLGLILAVPVFFSAKKLVVAYRSYLRDRIMKWRIMQAFKASAVFDLYQRWTSR
jgi:uncharacterized protein (TIGR03546 family)